MDTKHTPTDVIAYDYDELVRALKAVHVAIECNASRGGNLASLINKENPLTVEAIGAALAKVSDV